MQTMRTNLGPDRKSLLEVGMPPINGAYPDLMLQPVSDLKVAVISPFPEEGDTYPQVAYLAKWLRGHASVSWVTIEERGYRLDRLLDDTFLGFLNRFSPSALLAPANSLSIPRGSLRGTGRSARQLAADWRSVKQAVVQCDLVLAIDFMALVLGAAASSKPLVLWSHDFISFDEERYRRRINHWWLSAVRQALVRKKRRVIVQDADRCELLEASLGLEIGSLCPFYLPVSLPPVTSHVGVDCAGAWEGKPRVMQIGGLSEWRSRTDFLLEQHKLGHGRFELLLHGRVQQDVARQLESLNPKPILDESWLACDRIPEVVGQCSVGFVGYTPTDRSFFLLKNASGQLVEFLRCGKPVLSMGTNNIAELLESEGAGCGVSNSTDFFGALDRIHADYRRFSYNAKVLYDRHYNFERYSTSLLGFLRGAVDAARS